MNNTLPLNDYEKFFIYNYYHSIRISNDLNTSVWRYFNDIDSLGPEVQLSIKSKIEECDDIFQTRISNTTTNKNVGDVLNIITPKNKLTTGQKASIKRIKNFTTKFPQNLNKFFNSIEELDETQTEVLKLYFCSNKLYHLRNKKANNNKNIKKEYYMKYNKGINPEKQKTIKVEDDNISITPNEFNSSYYPFNDFIDGDYIGEGLDYSISDIIGASLLLNELNIYKRFNALECFELEDYVDDLTLLSEQSLLLLEDYYKILTSLNINDKSYIITYKDLWNVIYENDFILNNNTLTNNVSKNSLTLANNMLEYSLFNSIDIEKLEKHFNNHFFEVKKRIPYFTTALKIYFLLLKNVISNKKITFYDLFEISNFSNYILNTNKPSENSTSPLFSFKYFNNLKYWYSKGNTNEVNLTKLCKEYLHTSYQDFCSYNNFNGHFLPDDIGDFIFERYHNLETRHNLFKDYIISALCDIGEEKFIKEFIPRYNKIENIKISEDLVSSFNKSQKIQNCIDFIDTSRENLIRLALDNLYYYNDLDTADTSLSNCKNIFYKFKIENFNDTVFLHLNKFAAFADNLKNQLQDRFGNELNDFCIDYFEYSFNAIFILLEIEKISNYNFFMDNEIHSIKIKENYNEGVYTFEFSEEGDIFYYFK